VLSLQVSDVWETPPWGDVEGGSFLNCAASIDWEGSIWDFAGVCRTLELELGSTVEKHGRARVIDIDILCAEETVIETSQLIVPHPRMHLRRFVLQPLSEVWRGQIPGLDRTPKELLHSCTDQSLIIRFTTFAEDAFSGGEF